MKHGPNALIDEHMPTVVIATKDSIYGKVISNMQEVKARKGRIIARCRRGFAHFRINSKNTKTENEQELK